MYSLNPFYLFNNVAVSNCIHATNAVICPKVRLCLNGVRLVKHILLAWADIHGFLSVHIQSCEFTVLMFAESQIEILYKHCFLSLLCRLLGTIIVFWFSVLCNGFCSDTSEDYWNK